MKRLSEKHQHRHKGLVLIAILKFIKGSLLVLIGLAAVSLIGKDIGDLAENAMRWLHIDPNGKVFDAVLDKISIIDDKKLKQLGAGTFFYAALLLTEGFGLWFEKRWAEWLTVIASGSFIPIEVYEITKHATATKFSVLTLNIIIVVYLVWILKREKSAAG